MAEQGSVPRVGEVAEACLGQQINVEPIKPLDYAIVRDAQGRPLYMCVMCVGPENIDRLKQFIDAAKPLQQPVPELPGIEDE